MKKRLRGRRPSPAMVVAFIALCAGVTGGAYAAATIDGGDIVNGSITKKDLKKNSVNSKKVKNGSLKLADFGDDLSTGPQGPKGDKGDKGEPGEDGAPGATNAVTRITTASLGPGSVNLTAPCDTGERAVGGGPRFTNDEPEISVQQSYPSPATDGETPTGWTTRYVITGVAHSVSTAVVCVSP